MDYFGPEKIIIPERGDLLISEPYLKDPNFARTVILICENNENGSLGFVLNNSAKMKLKDVMDDAKSFDNQLFVGGPVERDTLHFIHSSQNLEESSMKLSDGIYWGGGFDEILSSMDAQTIDAEQVRFFAGYSGWSPGQLQGELETKSWIVFKSPTPEMIFEWDNEKLWKTCLESMGGKYRLIANYPKDPRLN